MPRNFSLTVSALIALAMVLPARADKMASGNKTVVPPPPLPAIRALKLEPSSLTLHDGRDEQRVLVWGKTDSGQWLDLTSQAVLKAGSANVEINSDGYIRPKSKGQTTVTISAAGKQIKLPVTVENATTPEIRFVRDIEPVLSKVGCNAGNMGGVKAEDYNQHNQSYSAEFTLLPLSVMAFQPER